MTRRKNKRAISRISDHSMKWDTTWKKLQDMSETISSLEKSLELTNKKIDSLAKIMVKNRSWAESEQLSDVRAKTEHFGERSERGEQTLGANKLNRIRGRHREILAMLINDGFHTYRKIAEKLGISESRARAYVAALKNDFGIPLKRVRDPEGYKIGIDVRFVERILTFR